jgi:hypothetical protein
MFTNMLGPAMDKYLNHYQQMLVIHQPILGQEAVQDNFVIDYRNTQDPIHDDVNDSIMFMFAGEFFYNG